MKNIRRIYNGALTYNCDKYQEHNVKWWDALDYISSSGYYPVGTISKELDRIEAVSYTHLDVYKRQIRIIRGL